MPQLRSKPELANFARAFALRHSMVLYKGTLYIPSHFITGDLDPQAPEETVWSPLDDHKVRIYANILLDILFATDAEERSFIKMLKQFATEKFFVEGILVRIKTDRVELLTETGELKPASGNFVPNYLDVPYDAESPLIDELYGYISEWLGSEEQAESLLHHFATALQPTWSAVKYVLMIGKGRNGKSTLLKMFEDLLGEDNVSGVRRQDMAANSTVMTALNGKLANIVLDGPKEFIRDSSNEKTLIAGERLNIELKYENAPARIQTNALFVEGLQHEPITSDKSIALQRRLVRFYFPNEYPLDLEFEDKMRRQDMLAALLHLLIKHWVNKTEVATKLALTIESLDLQVQAVWTASPVLRFLEWMSGRDSQFLQDILMQKMPVDKFTLPYREWLNENGYKQWDDSYVLKQLEESFEFGRKSFWMNGRNTTKRYIKSVYSDTLNAIQMLIAGESITPEGASEKDILNAIDE